MLITRPVPITAQVNEILRQRIREGTYVPGARLPSESELARELDVSRATIRTVLTRLAAEGLILRKQGDGTYINQHIQDINTHLGGLWEFGRLIESSGYQPSIEALSVTTRNAETSEAGELVIQYGEELLELKRLFFADSQPVILATNLMPFKFIDQSTGQLDGGLPIREFLQRYCHKRIAYAISDVQSTLTQGEAANILRLEPGSPILKIAIVLYDRDNRPLVSGQSFYNDAALRLRLVQVWE